MRIVRHQFVGVLVSILVVVGAGHHFNFLLVVIDREVEVIRSVVVISGSGINPDAFIESVESIAELHRGILFTAIAPSHWSACRPR